MIRFAEVFISIQMRPNVKKTHLWRREASGGIPISAGIKSGGVWLRVGGVEPSDTPEDPAVEGRPSNPSTVGFRDDVLFELETPSGHVHCGVSIIVAHWKYTMGHTSL